MKLTEAQRDKLIDKLVDDMVIAATGDRDFVAEFIDDAMRNGYRALTDMPDTDLLQMHIDSFDMDFDPEDDE